MKINRSEAISAICNTMTCSNGNIFKEFEINSLEFFRKIQVKILKILESILMKLI